MTLSLERRAALWGDRTAVADATDGRDASYADLDSRADALARGLAARGIGAGDAVAVVSRNRIETIALVFAARRLGAVLAPISHRLTPATVRAPLDAIDPAVVVHEPAQRDLVREVADDRSRSFDDLRGGEGADYEAADPDPDRSLLYLHTREEADRSAVGETDSEPDRPGESLNADPPAAGRVVDLPARAVEWNCITAAAAWGLGRSDRAPTLLPVSDTDGLHRLVLPLLYVGGRVDLLRAFAPERALAAIERGATALFAGATEYRELIADDAFESTDFGSVEWIGARSALPTDARAALAERAPVVRAYGRGETGPNDLYRPVDRGDADPPDPDCVGRPFPDCEARIVWEGEPVAESEVGELQIRGPVTARGYVGDAETFPEWVPSGDHAYREGGDYFVLGRAAEAAVGDERRVHPREVERELEAHEEVREAGAVVGGGESLAAVVGDAEPGELRAFVADRLPDAAVPREVTVVESLARRSTGEPDRAKLRRELGGEERFDTE
ncbi:class I adenylate-forming enzyme family protein [Halorussus marinus]|uniref:class I adenylate-forming enzyme family protein n=1 Tax=Halorussus marinus TaxID=2505976 RepID=UPI001092BC19|nr:AMP-binding protein [Halorussus marinus]